MYKKIFGILIIILFFINFTGCMDNKKKNHAPSQIPYSLGGTVTAHGKSLTNFTLIFYRNYSEQGRVRTDSNGTWGISNLSGEITIKSDISGWIFAPITVSQQNLNLNIQCEESIAYASWSQINGIESSVTIYNDNLTFNAYVPILVNPGYIKGKITWSPDRTKIAFARQNYTKQIYIKDLITGVEKQITNNSSDNIEPSWSPDGTKIAFVNGSITCTMNSDGSNVVQLINGQEPDWSPDSKKIVYVSNYPDYQNENAYELYIMDAIGGSSRRLTSDNYPEKNPAWSPDGTKIVFSSMREHGSALYTIDPNGNNLTDISLPPGTHYDNYYVDEEYPTWSPDGTKIMCVGENSLFVMNSDGSGYNCWIRSDDSYPTYVIKYGYPAWTR